MTAHPCPDCGHDMEVQHVCERCGKREATPDALWEAYRAGYAVAAGYAPEDESDLDPERTGFNYWLAGRTEGTP